MNVITAEVKAFKVVCEKNKQKDAKKDACVTAPGSQWWFNHCGLLAFFCYCWVLTICQTLYWTLDLHFLFCFLQPPYRYYLQPFYMALLSCPFYKWGNQGSVWDRSRIQTQSVNFTVCLFLHSHYLDSVCFCKLQKILMLSLNAGFLEIFIYCQTNFKTL